MSGEKMGLAEFLGFIQENMDVIFVRWEGKTVALTDIPTDEALALIHAWWVTGHVIHVVQRVH